ncbi:MAG: hypothetical protein AAGA23_02410, partial [Pseudomonadota bacterium]
LDGSYMQVFDITCCSAIDPPRPLSVLMSVQTPSGETFGIVCSPENEGIVTPYCILQDSSEQTVLTMFAGDMGTSSITGYFGEPVTVNSGRLRGEQLVFGRRIQGDPALR